MKKRKRTTEEDRERERKRPGRRLKEEWNGYDLCVCTQTITPTHPEQRMRHEPHKIHSREKIPVFSNSILKFPHIKSSTTPSYPHFKSWETSFISWRIFSSSYRRQCGVAKAVWWDLWERLKLFVAMPRHDNHPRPLSSLFVLPIKYHALCDTWTHISCQHNIYSFLRLSL